MENIDYLAEAGREIVRTDEYWGRIKVAAAPMAFSGKGQKPAPYDPTIHDAKNRFIEIEMILDPLPECPTRFPVTMRIADFSPDWQKIGLRSVKECGLVTDSGSADMRRLADSFVRVAQVPGFTKNKNPEKENYRTLKFLRVFANEADCRADYYETTGEDPNTEPAPQQPAASAANVAIALDFVKSYVKAQRSLKTPDDRLRIGLKQFISENKMVGDVLSIDSPEVVAILNEPPF